MIARCAMVLCVLMLSGCANREAAYWGGLSKRVGETTQQK